MNKTLVAMATLMAVGAASAQSVRIYGKVDATLRQVSQTVNGVRTAAGNPGWSVDSQGWQGSRWGMRGTESLGGGWEATFRLENGFTVDNGAFNAGNNLPFGRMAYVGLRSPWGEITAGRQQTLITQLGCPYDPSGCGTHNVLNGYAWGNTNGVGFHANRQRVDNSIQYTTPESLGGFEGSIMVAPGENRNPVTRQDAGLYTAFHLNYEHAPYAVGMVHENDRTTAAGGVSARTRYTAVFARYDLGVARLYAGVERASNSARARENGWTIATEIPLGMVALQLMYARETVDTNTAVDGNKRALAGALYHNLSKRTRVYTNFRSGKTQAGGAVAGAVTRDRMYGVGVIHDF